MRRPESGDGAIDVDHWDTAVSSDTPRSEMTDPSWAARALALARATYPGSLPAEPVDDQPDPETDADDTTTD